MKRKTWYLAAVLILLLLTPQMLRADDGLSLESIVKRVEILFQSQSDLETRMAAVETQIAPTPTKTPRPTATITPNATITKMAATARAHERATEVAQAKATVTAQAKATAQSRFRSRA